LAAVGNLVIIIALKKFTNIAILNPVLSAKLLDSLRKYGAIELVRMLPMLAHLQVCITNAERNELCVVWFIPPHPPIATRQRANGGSRIGRNEAEEETPVQ
jgi:hypothetical protein